MSDTKFLEYAGGQRPVLKLHQCGCCIVFGCRTNGRRRSDFLDPEGLSDRIDSLEAGLGGVYVTAIDFVTGPVLFLTRAVGLTGVADDVTEFKDSRRKRYFGPLKK